MVPFTTVDRPRVLVVAMAGIGNALMQSPVWTRLKRVNPSAEIAVLVGPRGTAAILEPNRDVSLTLRGEPKPSLRAWLGMVKTMQQRTFNIGLVTYPGQLVTSSSLLFFGSVRTRIGHRYAWRGLKNSRLFLTHGLDVLPVHDVEQNLQLLGPLGIPTDAGDARYVFPLTEEDRQAATQFLAHHGLANTRLVGFHPGAAPDMNFKRWPEDRWATLGITLADAYGATILLFGGPEERALRQRITSRMGTTPVHDVELPLRAAAAVMRCCLFFVSNDSGLMHVAVSQERPTFGLFGPTDERRTAPWGPHGHVIRAGGTKPVDDVRDRSTLKALKGPHHALLALSPGTVARAIAGHLPPP